MRLEYEPEHQSMSPDMQAMVWGEDNVFMSGIVLMLQVYVSFKRISIAANSW